MAIAQHRAPVVYAVSLPVAAGLALAVGMICGLAAALAIAPGSQSLTTGAVLGFALGAPAAVAVVFARRTVEQGGHALFVAGVSVVAVALMAAMLFAITQVDVALASVGAALGVVTGVLSLTAALWLHHRPRSAIDGEEPPRKH